MNNDLLNISQKNFNILKTILITQILLENLDEIKDTSLYSLKHKTKQYLTYLETQIEPIIYNTFKSNPIFFEELILETQQNINNINKKFNICEKHY